MTADPTRRLKKTGSSHYPRQSRVVTRKEAEWVMTEVVPVYAFEAFELALRSERPLLRIAALATFGRGGVQAGLVR